MKRSTAILLLLLVAAGFVAKWSVAVRRAAQSELFVERVFAIIYR